MGQQDDWRVVIRRCSKEFGDAIEDLNPIEIRGLGNQNRVR